MYCSNCGHELAPDAKFCSNCGAPVQSGASVAPGSPRESDRERERREDFQSAWGGWSSSDDRPSTTDADDAEPLEAPRAEPQEPADEFSGGFATDRKPTWEVERERLRGAPDDEWSMTNLGPAKPQRRRTWLWVLLGVIAFIVIACCVFGWWITGTESGQEWFNGVATQAAEEIQRATDEAATPQP